MPILQVVIQPGSTAKPIDILLSHPIRSQSLTLRRINVIKAATGSYDGNYYRLSMPFLTSSRQAMNNTNRGNLILPNSPQQRSFELTFDTKFTSDNIPESFQVLVQEADGTVVSNSTLKCIVATFDYQTNRLF